MHRKPYVHAAMAALVLASCGSRPSADSDARPSASTQRSRSVTDTTTTGGTVTALARTAPPSSPAGELPEVAYLDEIGRALVVWDLETSRLRHFSLPDVARVVQPLGGNSLVVTGRDNLWDPDDGRTWFLDLTSGIVSHVIEPATSGSPFFLTSDRDGFLWQAQSTERYLEVSIGGSGSPRAVETGREGGVARRMTPLGLVAVPEMELIGFDGTRWALPLTTEEYVGAGGTTLLGRRCAPVCVLEVFELPGKPIGQVPLANLLSDNLQGVPTADGEHAVLYAIDEVGGFRYWLADLRPLGEAPRELVRVVDRPATWSSDPDWLLFTDFNAPAHASAEERRPTARLIRLGDGESIFLDPLPEPPLPGSPLVLIARQ